MGKEITLAASVPTESIKSQYDAACKRVLAEKIILAWIMKYSMEEYVNFDISEIAERYIEGEPEISEIPVHPDETNIPRINGTGVEDVTVTEGTITYDIRFTAALPKSNERIGLIINIEAQNDFYPGYPLIKRGIYYGSRMISSQYGTVFTKSHYEKIKKVYSVWICMNPPQKRANSITQYSFTEKNVFGNVKEKTELYDLISIVMICLGDQIVKEENLLLGMLDTLFRSDLDANERRKMLEEKYHLPISERMESEVSRMCNYSDGIEQRGIEKGIWQAKIENAKNLLDVLPDEIIAEKIGLSLKKVKELRAQKSDFNGITS